MRTHENGTTRPTPRRRTPFGLLATFAVATATALVLPIGNAGAATTPIDLGTAKNFAVLAGSGITNTGPTTINGDIGTFPTPTETGRASIVLTGTDHAGDAVTQQAKIDLITAYNQAAGAGPAAAVATELGGRTLTPGVYASPTLGITGTLYLDTQGDPSAVFVFQSSSTLITASASSIVVLNSPTACNVFWQVGSSATLGTNSSFLGTILAQTSITATTQASIRGRLLAQNGATTLDTNTITPIPCTPTVAPTIAPFVVPPSTAPTTTAPTTTVTTTATSPTTVTTAATSPTTVTTTTTITAQAPASAPSAPPTPPNSPPPGPTPGTLPIAYTGFDGGAAALGAAMVLAGAVLLATSSDRRRNRGRHSR